MVSLNLILDGIRRWEAERRTDPRREERVRKQVATAVEPFLGSRASSRVLSPVSADNANLLQTVEGTLKTFLGAKAAASLVDRAMDQVFMRS
jgi:hypothetical protein